MAAAAVIFIVVSGVFFALAKMNARPGFNAFALALLLAFTPSISSHLPGNGDSRDLSAVALFLVAASIGTALGGGLKAHDEEHDHHHESHGH